MRPHRPGRRRHRRVARDRQGPGARPRRTRREGRVRGAQLDHEQAERPPGHDPRRRSTRSRRGRHRDRGPVRHRRPPTTSRGSSTTTVDEFGRLDVLVNNAMTPTRASFEESTVEQWDESMRVNVRSLYLFTQGRRTADGAARAAAASSTSRRAAPSTRRSRSCRPATSSTSSPRPRSSASRARSRPSCGRSASR